MGCIFCEIVAGRSPAFRVCEDEQTLAFLDLFPVATGHALVVPRAHSENLFEAAPEVLAAVIRTSKRVALALRKELAPDGLAVIQLNGAAAGQTVFHYHMHLIPRRSGEPLQVHSRVRGDDQELDRVALRLRSALEDPGAGG